MALVKLIHSRVVKDGEGRITAGIDVPFGPPGKPTVVYKFRPKDPKDPINDQVCEVTNPEHLAAFLSIPEGYDVTFADKDKSVDKDQLDKEAQAIIQKRVDDAKATQKRLNEAADRRQRKAKEMKGKKAPLETIASLDD